jgi:hypothetical protein
MIRRIGRVRKLPTRRPSTWEIRTGRRLLRFIGPVRADAAAIDASQELLVAGSAEFASTSKSIILRAD